MKQEDKDLLLKDLCARLPYGVIGLYSWKKRVPYRRELTVDIFDELQLSWSYPPDDAEFFPYLRPMSDMTEEDNLSLSEYVGCSIRVNYGEIYFPHIEDNTSDKWEKVFDWLNAHHFDYRDLIEKGLAISAEGSNLYN